MNLSRFGKVTRVSNAVAAGTTTVNCATIDMKGFDSVTFYLLVGTLTATNVTTLKAQQGAASDMSDAADLLGTAVAYTDADDDKAAILEVHNPRERYVRAVVVRATANAVIDGVIAVQTKANKEPVTHDSTTVVGSEFHQAPAEGTA